MEWTGQHDVLFCREILAVELFKTKKKTTTHRAELWTKIAENLNGYDNPKFKVSKRAVRDWCGIISAKHKKENKRRGKSFRFYRWKIQNWMYFLKKLLNGKI